SGLGDIDDRHGDARAGAWPAVRCANVRAAGLLDALQLALGIGQARFGKQISAVATAALEDAEDVPGLDAFPGGQRIELRQNAGIECRLVVLDDRAFD